MSSRLFQAPGEGWASLPHASCWASCFPVQLTRNLQKIFSLAADERLAAPDMPSRRRPSLQWPPPAAAARRRGRGQGESSDHIVLNRVLSPFGVGELTGLGHGVPRGTLLADQTSPKPLACGHRARGRGRPSSRPDPGSLLPWLKGLASWQ
uniref:Uncharacterized protein n=1 Tax=Myotis myotis TaxID=51298 RepID=A0A7J7T5Q4_MYOMY|nr:hypothetical protein mMyoMyo1_009124 [Myotis myotis]